MALKEENRAKAEVYLKSRGLNLFPAAGFIDSFYFKGSFLNDYLAFFINDICGELTLIQARSKNERDYQSLWYKKECCHFYNIRAVLDAEAIILTEGVLDAESVLQSLGGHPGVTVMGLGTATISTAQKYFLAYLMVGKKAYLAFDNDDIGIKSARGLLDFYKFKFGMDFGIIDYPGKDPNSLLQKKGSGFVKTTFMSQID